jgi:putative SOS response-associated peptidase YedK
MPVILPRDAEAAWLDRSLEDPEQLLPLLVPYSAENMDAYAVSLAVNSPRNDSPACIEPTD